MTDRLTIINADVMDGLARLPDESVNCCVTSPPYWGLRDYGVSGQIGLEKTPQEFVARMVEVFREVRRVLRRDGVCWVNLGDSYSSGGSTTQVASTLRTATRDAASGKQEYLNNFAVRLGPPEGLKPKDLVGIPWRVALALQADGWWLRQDIIWHKPNPMPESVQDRCTKAHEYLFLLTKAARYWWDGDAMKVVSSAPPHSPGNKKLDASRNDRTRMDKLWGGGTRNRRSVWTIPTQPVQDAHFATFPEQLPKLCIMAGCPMGGTVLDPFGGSGTTGRVALELGRKAVMIELNPDYVKLIEQRTNVTPAML